MKKKYSWLIILDLMVAGLCSIYFDNSTMYYCGKKDEKPSLALGLSPSWFDGRFQISRGYTEIISSTDRLFPTFDKWVKGAELFKTILEYDVGDNDSGVFFKALNWDDRKQVFLLRKYSPSDEEKYVYEVVAQEGVDVAPDWVGVGQFSCREGVYRGLMYLFLLLVFVVNVVVILKGVWVKVRKNNGERF